MAAELTYMVNVLLTEDNEFPWDEEIRLGFANKTFTVRKGKSVFVPLEAMIIACGDPRSTDKIITVREAGGEATGWIPDREGEVYRLRSKYGQEPTGRKDFDDIHVPKIEVTNLEGERVYTVLDDPYGEKGIVTTSTTAEKDELLAMLERQQGQIDKLRSELGTLDEVQNEMDLPTDDSIPPLFVGTGNGQ